MGAHPYCIPHHPNDRRRAAYCRTPRRRRRRRRRLARGPLKLQPPRVRERGDAVVTSQHQETTSVVVVAAAGDGRQGVIRPGRGSLAVRSRRAGLHLPSHGVPEHNTPAPTQPQRSRAVRTPRQLVSPSPSPTSLGASDSLPPRLFPPLSTTAGAHRRNTTIVSRYTFCCGRESLRNTPTAQPPLFRVTHGPHPRERAAESHRAVCVNSTGQRPHRSSTVVLSVSLSDKRTHQ